MKTSEYFEVVSTDGQVYWFKIRGFWNDQMADAVGEDLLKEFQKPILGYKNKKWVALPDMRELKISTEKGKAILSRMMKFAMENKMFYSYEVIPSAVARMGLDDAAKKAHFDEGREVLTDFEAAKEQAHKKVLEIK